MFYSTSISYVETSDIIVLLTTTAWEVFTYEEVGYQHFDFYLVSFYNLDPSDVNWTHPGL